MGKAIMNRLEKAAGHLRRSAAAIVKEQKYRRITFVSGSDTARGPKMCIRDRMETLEEAAMVHGIDSALLVEKINAAMTAAGK